MTISPMPTNLARRDVDFLATFHACHVVRGLGRDGLAAEPLKIDFLRRSARFTWNLPQKPCFGLAILLGSFALSTVTMVAGRVLKREQLTGANWIRPDCGRAGCMSWLIRRPRKNLIKTFNCRR